MFNRLSLKLEFIIRAILLLAVCGAAATPAYDDSEGAAVAALAVATGGQIIGMMHTLFNLLCKPVKSRHKAAGDLD